MAYELITDEEYDSLPEASDQKFAKLEQVCRRNMNSLLDDGNNSNQSFYDTIQLEYMTIVAAAAEELGVEGLYYPDESQKIWPQLTAFMLRANGITTRIRLRSSQPCKASSVLLAARTRGKVEQQIRVLREVIATEVAPESRQKTLLKKLEELSTELSQPRVSFAKVMTVLTAVAACTTIGANGPKAIHNIMHLLGIDKAAEEVEAERLGPPARNPQLAPPSSANRPQLQAKMSEIIDDDIPF